MKKQILTTFLTTVLLATTVTPILASTVSAPGQASSMATLNAESTRLDVTVPTSVLLYVTSAGDTLTPDNLEIVNNSVAPIVVKSLAVTTEPDWTLDPATTDYTNFKSGRKNFLMTFNDLDPSIGALAFESPIFGHSNLLLDLFAEVAPQKDAVTALKIGEILVIVDWYADEEPDEEPDEETEEPGDPDKGEEPTIPEGYVMATDADFGGETDGNFYYTGTDDYIIIPHVIKGVPVTSYAGMFGMNPVSGVYSDNPNVVSTNGMCRNSGRESLDLSHFDLSTVTDITDMFAFTFTTQVYTKTQADADRLSAIGFEAASVVFSVK